MTNNRSILILIPVVLIAYLLGYSKREVVLIPKQDLNEVEKVAIDKYVQSSDFIYFYDYDCIYCAEFLPILEQVYSSYKDDIDFRFINTKARNSSIDSTLIKGAICSEKMEYFFKYSKVVYNQKDSDGLVAISDLPVLLNFSDKANDEFISCLDSDSTQKIMRENELLLQILNIPVTPSLVIGSNIFEGVIEYNFLSEIIEMGL